MQPSIVEENGFSYVETGGHGDCLLLLHGLFGALSNFEHLINEFSKDYNVVVPILPIYTLSRDEAGLTGLLRYVREFVELKGYSKIHLVGNSLGGHIAQLYALERPELIASITLTGSSGLFESGMGDGYPRRGDYDYIKRKTAETFYDPEVATKELVDEVFETVNDRNKAMSILLTARSALKHNLEDKIPTITCPALLVWGNQDTITPPFVGEKFDALLPNSTLVFIDQCGHAPMMEVPVQFNNELRTFLTGISN
jgi:pimeloyl-ACP methyl ester carboxylesterase